MAEAQKETIYIDIDDEITSLVDKVQAAKHKIVALVLPKRATVLQSIVNMKLLKRTADDTSKKVVLITSESGLMPLAGAVGIYVAKTLQSKPHIPSPPEKEPGPEPVVEDEDEDEAEESEVDHRRSIGELAGLSSAEEETIELDDPEESEEKVPKTKGKKNKKFKIPDFNKFRVRLFLGIGAFLLLIIAWFILGSVLPKAKITIKTNTQSVNANLNFTANAAVKELNEAENIVPATVKEVKKSEVEKTPTTGEKDTGEKATGTVTLKNCTRTDGSVSVPAGTALSTGGLVFLTSAAVSLPASEFTGGGTCTTDTEDVGVVAQNAGTQYNVSGGKTFSVSGFSGITGTDSSDMTGGTSKIVKVVSDQDINNAKQRAMERSNAAAETELKEVLAAEQFFALGETLTVGTPNVKAEPKAGSEAGEVTVTVETTYTMLGANKEHLEKIIENEAKKQIDTEKQQISDSGLVTAAIKITEKKSPTDVKFSLSTVVVAGAQIKQDELKGQIAGKKRGEVESHIRSLPGVVDVEIEYSPFWVYSTPKKASKIQIILEQPESQQ